MNDFDREQRLAKKRKYQEKYRNSTKGKITQIKATSKQRATLEVDVERFLNDAITRAKNRAKKKNIPCTISKEDLRQKFNETDWKCAISKIPVTMKHHDRFKASIDRIDSSKGYTLDNIQIVAACVNMAKSAGTDKELIEMCKAIVNANS
jgi:hypothetical protein